MKLKIALTSAQIESLARFASEALPNESCAFLLGISDESRVKEILFMKNADNSPYTFSIKASELIKAYDTAEKKGFQVIGIFHSHPGRPSPSATDLKYMEINPVTWLIYSTTEKRFSAYLSEGGLINYDIVITD